VLSSCVGSVPLSCWLFESLNNHRFQSVPVYDNHPILVCLYILYISYIHVHVLMCVTLLVLIVLGADLEVY